MKRLLLLLLLPLFMVSCSKDNTPLSVMVNVEYDGDLAAPSLVRLYKYDELHSELMRQASETGVNNAYKYGSDLGFILEDGSKISPVYTSDSNAGVNIFENIEAGRYYIIVMYKPNGYNFSFSWHYGYKDVTVDKSNNAMLYTCNFPRMINGETSSGKWYKF